jgi:putative ABC transport system permease protein
MGSFWQDVVVARRSLARQGGLWALAVLALAAGVGVNSSVYALLRSIFDRPFQALKVPNTVMMLASNPQQGRERRPVTRAEFRYWREHSTSYALLAAYDQESYSIGGEPGAERVQGIRVTPDFFPLIGARTQLGRLFDAREYQAGDNRVVILTHDFWKRRFAPDRGIAGQTIRLDGESYLVAGVAAEGMWWPTAKAQMWLPMAQTNDEGLDRKREVSVIAALKKGVDSGQAQAEMNGMMTTLARLYPEASGDWKVSVLTPSDALFSQNDRIARPLLLVLAGCVLLLACANVANLLLVRSIGRRREIAIRKSMGAGIGSLARQIAAEALWLAVPACVAGVLFAEWSVPLLLKGFPGLDLQVPKNAVDYGVIAFTATIAIASIFIFSLAPLWQGQRTSIAEAIRSTGARTGADRRTRRLSSVFVVAQAALAMGLVGSAILVAEAMHKAVYLNPGFNVKNVAQVRADLARSRYPTEQSTVSYFEEAVRRASAVPGVRSAAAISMVPYIDGNGVNTACATENMVEREAKLPQCGVIAVTPGALATLELPLVRGRAIEPGDTAAAPPVVVVNEAAVRRLWKGADPIGRRVRLVEFGNRWFTVAGVAGDVKRINLRQPVGSMFFVAAAQVPFRSMAVIARTDMPAETVAGGLRSAIQSVDIEEPLVANTLEAEQFRNIQGGVTFAGLLCAMGALSLFLAAVGLFSLLAYQVWDRSRDIGLRIALGASQRDITARVGAQVLTLTIPGLVLGALLSIVLGKRLEGVLYGVTVTQPLVLGGAVGLLLATALLAAIVPARRAACVDPAIALRQE